MTTRRITTIALLVATCTILRLALVELPNIKPITALFFLFILFLGLSDSLIIMTLTMLLTGFMLGFSPLVIGQVLVYALLMLVFWLLSKRKAPIWLMAGLAFVLPFFYGLGTDLMSAALFGLYGQTFYAYWLAGLPFDLAHGVSTLVFFLIFYFIFDRTKLQKKL
ncbi:ECF transporter S component [Lactococcus termiticola]|nr:ECF transporter S component [Lactococcus termiticola]